jgi:hypothetical protein
MGSFALKALKGRRKYSWAYRSSLSTVTPHIKSGQRDGIRGQGQGPKQVEELTNEDDCQERLLVQGDEEEYSGTLWACSVVTLLPRHETIQFSQLTWSPQIRALEQEPRLSYSWARAYFHEGYRPMQILNGHLILRCMYSHRHSQLPQPQLYKLSPQRSIS